MDDEEAELPQSFTVTLSAASAEVFLATTTVTIIDNDGGATATTAQPPGGGDGTFGKSSSIEITFLYFFQIQFNHSKVPLATSHAGVSVW